MLERGANGRIDLSNELRKRSVAAQVRPDRQGVHEVAHHALEFRRVRALVGEPMTISDAPLWRCSSTLNAASSTENSVVPSARASPLSSSTIGPFTMKLRAAPGPSG